ncbi:MAG: hypothetical protein H0T49_03860 [Chloroflexia bacterium]|nr:hypothetical protein [Chloroflexia bacterium]
MPIVLPAWVPSERWVSSLLVLLVVFGAALAGGLNGRTSPEVKESEAQLGAAELSGGGANAAVAPLVIAAETATAVATGIPAPLLPTATIPVPTATVAAEAPAVNIPPAFSSNPAEVQAGALFPANRILAYYGHPATGQMGILGEYSMDELLVRAREQAAAYELIDPSRPVIPAFELIASVAQPNAQPDGSYLLDTPAETLDEYAEFTAANDILLILDLQIGRRTVAEEIEGLRPWLELPNVHVALDPEFAMAEGEIPGEVIGQIDAADVLYAQQWLAELSASAGIPPKVLIVHQFHYSMIANKELIAPVPGVQLVIDSDGWGPPDMKADTYGVVNTEQPIEYDGIKLFYRQDNPLMTPEEILALDPVPDLIIYQ